MEDADEVSVMETGPSTSELGREVLLRFGRGLTLRLKEISEAEKDDAENTDIVAIATGPLV
jgi:hypothetical protein